MYDIGIRHCLLAANDEPGGDSGKPQGGIMTYDPKAKTYRFEKRTEPR
jgi:hypothetical protein